MHGRRLTVGSLFSGCGLIEFGLERTGGFETVWQSEIDPAACQVLAHHYPGVPNLGDIRRVDWSNVRRPDVVCGGFPCQPASTAGSRRGVKDERWLWPEFARCIRETRPRLVMAENVPGLLSVDAGGAFGDVLRDLAQAGYDAEWTTLRAGDFGSPQIRERVFLVAYPTEFPQREPLDGTVPQPPRRDPRTQPRGRGWRVLPDDLADAPSRRRHPGEPLEQAGRAAALGNGQGPMGDADESGLEGRSITLRGRTYQCAPWPPGPTDAGGWAAYLAKWPNLAPATPTQPRVRGGSDGRPGWMDRLRLLGNSVNPDCAEWIGLWILEAEETLHLTPRAPRPSS